MGRRAAAGGGIAPAPQMLLDDPGAALGIAPWAPGDRVDQDFDLAGRQYAEQAETKEPAQFAHPRIVLTASAAPRGADGEPDLIARGRAIDGLQDQIEGESELQLADDDRGGLMAVQRHQIAAAHLALDLEAQVFEEALDRQIEARFQGALGP